MGIGDLHRRGPCPRTDAHRRHATRGGRRLLLGNRGPLPKATDKLDLRGSGQAWGSSLGSRLEISPVIEPALFFIPTGLDRSAPLPPLWGPCHGRG
jgi:hypothetical protein